MSATRTPARIAIAILAAAVGAIGLAAPGLARAASTPAPTVWGWGENDDFALGTSSSSADNLSPVKVKLPKGVTVTSVRSGCDDGVALTKSGALLAWGDNVYGELGDATRTNRSKPVPVKLPKATTVIAVRAGCDDTIALTKAGTVLAWGRDTDDQLGNGGTKNSGQPVGVKLPKDTKIKAISAGCQHNLALTTTGKVYAWGQNKAGQLGDGTKKRRKTPIAVKLPSGIVATGVSAGCDFSFALTKEGLFGWGDNSFGQLGIPAVTSQPTPQLIPMLFRGTGPGTITQLFAGQRFTVALFSKGAVLAWGDDTFGQLGDGGTTPSYKPVAVPLPAGEKVHSISAGLVDGYAQLATGKVYAWGYGNTGELGDGTDLGGGAPVQVKLPVTVNPIAIGSGPAAERAFAINIKATS